MSRAGDVAGRVGWTLSIAFLVSPAFAPIRELLASATELTGTPTPQWVPLVLLLAVGFVLAETYEGPTTVLLPTAILTALLFVGLQRLVGLSELDVISMQLLVANALVYLAALSSAVAIVFETSARERVIGLISGAKSDSRTE